MAKDNIQASEQFGLQIKKYLLRNAEKAVNASPKELSARIFELIKEKIPVGTDETSSVYPGHARDSWTLTKDRQRKWIIKSQVSEGYNYNWVLEFGGNPWAKPEGTKHLTPEGFSTQAKEGFIRLAIEQAKAEFRSRS